MKSTLTIEIENFLGFGDFKWITADPIDDIAPRGHTAIAAILAPGVKGAEEQKVLENGTPPEMKGAGPKDEEAEGGWEGVIEALDLPPATADFALIVVNGDEESAAGLDEWDDVVESRPHGASVVEDAPAIDDVEFTEVGEVILIEDGSLFDGPGGILGEVAAFEFACAGGGMGIEIEGVDGCAEAARGEAKQTAAAAGVEESPAGERGTLQHGSDGLLGQGDALVVEQLEELSPVFPKFKPLSGGYFLRMYIHEMNRFSTSATALVSQIHRRIG